MTKFVWVRGLKGPAPEKWPDDERIGGAHAEVLAEHPLTPTLAELSLAQLAELHPAPAEGTDHGNANAA